MNHPLRSNSPLPVFLTGEWRYLVMVNYEVDPAILKNFVPRGVELDGYNGRTFVSMVGFLFLSTKVFGFRFPFHTNFEEVNLRFYVRRPQPDGSFRRGVVFVREIVPRLAIATIARLCYNEPYIARPMRHHIGRTPQGVTARFEWKFGGRCTVSPLTHPIRFHKRWLPVRWRNLSLSIIGDTRPSATAVVWNTRWNIRAGGRGRRPLTNLIAT